MASLVLQTAFGLTFIFAVFAAAVSGMSEAVARYLGLRAEYLLRGIRSLVDGESCFRLPWRELMPWGMGQFFVNRRVVKPAAGIAQATPGESGPDGDEALVAKIMSHPLVASSAQQATPPEKAGERPLSNKDRRDLPSYLSGRTFARALTDILVHENSGPGDTNPLNALRDWAGSMSSAKQPSRHAHLVMALRPLLAAAPDLNALEASIAAWYDDQMARVSGWYKRHVKWVSLGIGLAVVLVFNVNAIRIADALYSNQALSTSVVSEATRASSCQAKDPATCLADLRTEIGKIRGAGLPIGWAEIPECAGRPTCSWMDRHGLASIGKNGSADLWTFLLVLLGWTVMILALLPGARFWFDLLSRLGSLRSTGPKPAP